MRTIYSEQYSSDCVLAEPGDTADSVIDRCRDIGAVRYYDGEEFVVMLRGEVGPELWTESSLRRSFPLEDSVKDLDGWIRYGRDMPARDTTEYVWWCRGAGDEAWHRTKDIPETCRQAVEYVAALAPMNEAMTDRELAERVFMAFGGWLSLCRVVWFWVRHRLWLHEKGRRRW